MSEESNILSASVPIKLDGQDFVLRYRALAFMRYAEECKADLLNDYRRIGIELEESTKGISGKEKNAADDQAAAVSMMDDIAKKFPKVRDVLWAGLIDAQPMLKRDDVARFIDFRNLKDVMLAIGEAIKLTMPEIETSHPPQPRPNPKKSRSAGGPNSGLSLDTPAESQPASSAS